MADIFSPEKRSEVMGKIRGKNTSLELEVFHYLKKRKVYFQKHYKGAPGSPDLALPRKKRAVFIDGDFWHGHNFEERKARLTASGQTYWVEKIERNMTRDVRQNSELLERGWQVLRIWEHRIKRKRDRQEALDEIEAFLLA